MDIAIEFQIHKVPDSATADRITADIMNTLLEKHSTDIWITWEEV